MIGKKGEKDDARENKRLQKKEPPDKGGQVANRAYRDALKIGTGEADK